MKMSKKIPLIVLSIAMLSLMAVLAACQPNQERIASSGQENESKQESIVQVGWSIDSDCITCHTIEDASLSDTTALYSMHAGLEYGDCTSCHTDEGGKLSANHKNYMDSSASMPIRLKNTSVSEGNCTTSGCHGVDELISSTEGYTKLADVEGTSVNPHTMLVDENHADAAIMCTNCHKMHSSNSIDDQAAISNAMAKCESCHHEGIFECYTCHS